MPSTVNKRCVVYILAKRLRLQIVSLKFLWFFIISDTTCLTIAKYYDDIATYEVSVCAWRNWRYAVVCVLAVVIFGKNLVPKQDMVPYEAFWHMDTTNCNLSKIGSKIIAIRFYETWNRILKACIALKPEGDEKLKLRNSINDWRRDKRALISLTSLSRKLTSKFVTFFPWSNQMHDDVNAVSYAFARCRNRQQIYKITWWISNYWTLH